MRNRSVVALSIAATALLLATGQVSAAVRHGVQPAAKTATQTAACPKKALKAGARQSDDPTVVRLSVTNKSARACTVGRIPTVTFGDLDGAALPVPEGASGPYRVGAGKTAYAAVRTIADLSGPEARSVGTITVSANPAHPGRTFTARHLGAGDEVLVWEPVTTWWKPSVAAAGKALEDAVD